MHSLLNLVAWLFLLVTSIGAGYAVCRVLHLPLSPRLDTVVISLAIGLGLLIYGVAALGFAHLLRSSFLLCWLGLVFAFSVVGHALLWRQSNTEIHSTGLAEVTVYPRRGTNLILMLLMVAFLLSTMVPPMNGDTLYTYLDIPRQYLDRGGIVPLPYEVLSNLPMNIPMLSVLTVV